MPKGPIIEKWNWFPCGHRNGESLGYWIAMVGPFCLEVGGPGERSATPVPRDHAGPWHVFSAIGGALDHPIPWGKFAGGPYRSARTAKTAVEKRLAQHLRWLAEQTSALTERTAQ